MCLWYFDLTYDLIFFKKSNFMWYFLLSSYFSGSNHNHVHNILKFDKVSAQAPFSTWYKNVLYELPHELWNSLRLMILEK